MLGGSKVSGARSGEPRSGSWTCSSRLLFPARYCCRAVCASGWGRQTLTEIPSQVGLLHEMLLEMVGASDVEAARSASRAGDEAIAPVTMADTRIWGSRLMQPQEMNSSNNIFGGAYCANLRIGVRMRDHGVRMAGYLMRIGYEVAKANALTFVGRAAQSAGVAAYPLLLAVNDITVRCTACTVLSGAECHCVCVCVCVAVWLCGGCVWWLCMAVCDCGDSVGLGRGILTHALLPPCACA